jgi:hypothetical protein
MVGRSAVWIKREFGDLAKAITLQWRVLRKNIPRNRGDRCDRFRIAFSHVTNPRNERTLIATLIPPGVICDNAVPTIIFDAGYEWAYLPWLAVANSFTMDALLHRKLTSPNLTCSVLDSLPFPRPTLIDPLVRRVAPVVLRLVCTTPEMTPYWNLIAALGFVEPVVEGMVPPTALIEPTARAQVRAELDAFVGGHVFGLTSQELSDLLDTFEVLQRCDQKAYGTFYTKQLVLEAFARLT